MALLIRNILPEDNDPLAAVIRRSMEEFDVDLGGSVYADPMLNEMYERYSESGSHYFVAVDDGILLGGSGIAPLGVGNPGICELQRMFLSKDVRGRGIGRKLMDRCISWARSAGYQVCYLETFSEMKNAIQLYEKSGFLNIKQPLGNTGHYSCNIWMTKKL